MSDVSIQNFFSPSPPSIEPQSCLWQVLSLGKTYIVQPVLWICSELYDLVKTIVTTVYRVFREIPYICLISELGGQRPEVPHPGFENMTLYFNYVRTLLTPPEPLDLRVVGRRFHLEESINPEHFNHTPPAPISIGQPPATNLDQLMIFFDTWIRPENTDLDLSDSDTPIKDVAQLRQGLENYISLNREESYTCSIEILALGQHLVHFLSSDKCDEVQKRQCLIDLARGGHRKCPTRMFQSSMHYFRLFSGNFHFNTLQEAVYESLHDLRLSILYKMAEESGEELVHAIGELTLTVGTRVGIRDAAAGGYNDHISLMCKFSPASSLPIFFSRYTKEAIISHLLYALNGDPGKIDASLRINTSISRELVTNWFLANYQKNQDVSEFMLDAADNTVKRQAVEYFLSRMGVLYN